MQRTHLAFDDGAYLADLRRRPPNTHEKNCHLAKQRREAKKAGNDVAWLDARNQLAEGNLRLTFSIVRRHRVYAIPVDDFVQAANEGLITAAGRWDERRGFRFSTYAHWWMLHAIQVYIHKMNKTVRVPQYLIDRWHLVHKQRLKLCRQFEHEPTAEEISRDIPLTSEQVREARLHVERPTLSLSQLLPSLEGDEDGGTADALTEDKRVFRPDEVVELREELASLCHQMNRICSCVAALPARERIVFCLRLGLDGSFAPKPLREIGAHFNICGESVRLIVRKVWRLLEKFGLNKLDNQWYGVTLLRIEELERATGHNRWEFLHIPPLPAVTTPDHPQTERAPATVPVRAYVS